MSTPDDVLTLTAYFAERERHAHRFLADDMFDLFGRRRIAASVLLRGIASFGPANIARTDLSLSLSEDPPVTVCAVDTAERIGALASTVATMTGRGVITMERSSTGLPPAAPGGSVRLSLYVGRRRRVGGVPGYVAVCDVLHRHGFAAADVFLGVDGTVAGQRRRARFIGRNGEVPLLVTGIGTVAQAASAIDEVRSILPDALLTCAPAVVCKDDGRRVAEPPAAGTEPFLKLTVHTWEDSRDDGRPIHRALIQRLMNSGHASGATVLRAIWGFHGHQSPRGDRLLQLSRHVPVNTVVIDTAERIAASYPIVDEETSTQGTVTCEAVPAVLGIDGEHRQGHLEMP